jgi:alkanesulfonate monooxygenase SsuD/methylene tetrahydromethanopterin reductase-like flavin-dependent oxidoreductase (luciferase family)
MTRGFGIDATVPFDVAMEVAGLVEQAGYGSFWVNGSPHEAALDIIEGALNKTSLDVGVGVFPLPKISATELVAEVTGRRLPQDRIRLGVGSGRRPGALDEVRQAVQVLRDGLDVEVVTGAVGPKMMALAGEVADAVVLTWSFVAEVERARPILEEAAASAGRPVPPIISFIRCALMPESAEALAERAAAYDAIPHYHAVFTRHGMTAADTVVQGADRAALIEGIGREEAAVDEPVIRAITPDHTVASLASLIEACAP